MQTRPRYRIATRLLAAGAAVLGLSRSSPGAADTVVLKSGRVIEAEGAWYESTEVRYQKDGGVYVLPRDLVDRIESPTGEAGLDPDILRSRDRLAARDPGEALRHARLALFRDPRSVPALQALAAAQLALGDPGRAKESASQALRLDEADPRSRALLDEALAALGERQQGSSDAQFRIRYEGSMNEPIGMAVLKILTEAHAEYAKRLGFRPEQPVTVVLQTGASFRDTTRAPDWADGWNDGTIQAPVLGLDAPNPRLTRILRHELAHSFVASRTRNNCPVWLHEGVAQWLEGGEPDRDDALLAPLARAGRLPSLLTLEGPFRGLSEAQATSAYATSLAAVAYILRLRGEAGLLRLLAALSDRLPSDDALPVAVGLSYSDLQKGLADHLRTADAKATAARVSSAP